MPHSAEAAVARLLHCPHKTFINIGWATRRKRRMTTKPESWLLSKSPPLCILWCHPTNSNFSRSERCFYRSRLRLAVVLLQMVLTRSSINMYQLESRLPSSSVCRWLPKLFIFHQPTMCWSPMSSWRNWGKKSESYENTHVYPFKTGRSSSTKLVRSKIRCMRQVQESLRHP